MGDGNNSGPMGGWYVVCLAVYLFLAALLSGGAVYTLWLVDFKPAANAVDKTAPNAVDKTALPGADKTAPNAGDKTAPAGGDKTAPAGAPPAAPAGTAQTAPPGGDKTAPPGDDKTTPPGGDRIAPTETGQAHWDFLWLHPLITQDVQMLLLAIFMGAFGSAINAMKSLADFKGEEQLTQSWLTFYFVQPPEGAGIAVLLYFALRGGLMAGTTVANSTTLFSICAIAGLAGAFSDTAFAKLNEIFDALFKPTDTRSGKLVGSLQITTTSLPDGAHGQPYAPVQLTVQNGAAPLTWTVTPTLPAGLSFDAVTGTISGTPTAASAKTSYTFKVTDSSAPPASTSTILTLTVS
jgi:hypothetical protein